MNQADRFTHDWSVDLDQFTLPSGEKRLKLCRHSLSFIYGLKPNAMNRIAKAMKDLQSSEIKSAKQEKPFDHRSYFGNDYSLNDIQAIFDANGLDVGISEARSGLVRASFSHIDAYLWMENYFYQFEHQPNSEEIHIDATWKVSIFNEYLESISTTNASKISLGQFKELWLALFNVVKIRKVKKVSRFSFVSLSPVVHISFGSKIVSNKTALKLFRDRTRDKNLLILYCSMTGQCAVFEENWIDLNEPIVLPKMYFNMYYFSATTFVLNRWVVAQCQ